MSYAQPSYAQPRHGDPTDVMGRRILAHIVDLIIIAIVAGLLFFATAHKITGVPDDYCTSNRYELVRANSCVNVGNTAYEMGGGATVGGIALVLGYWVIVGVIEGNSGAFVGKRMAGLRVVGADGQRAGGGKGALRGFLMLVDSMLCFLIGLITASVTHPHRRIGDMAATTYVVGKESVGHRIAPAATAPAGYHAPPPYAAAPNPSHGGWAAPPPANDPANSGWAAPAPASDPANSGWPAPAPDPTPVAPQQPVVTDPSEPHWDPQRNAWIAWEPTRGQWMQFDAATNEWRAM